MTRLCSFLLVFAALTLPVHAQPSGAGEEAADTTAASANEADWLLLPFASYAPETKLSGGVTAGYYWPARNGTPSSSLQATITVTQRRQLIAQFDPELYLDGGRWRVQGELRATHFPNAFFGIGGNTPPSAKESYTERTGVLDLVVQRRLSPSLRVGPRFFTWGGTIRESDDGGLIDQNQVPGSDGGLVPGVGLSVFWDARDNLYYPTTGTYADVGATLHSAAWGSDYTFGRLLADLRGYRSLGPGVMAAQVYAETIVGTAPFQLLPLLGGADRMRGYRKGRFRDNVYWTVQAEYRFPLFWRLKGTTFASVGEVGPRVGAPLTNDVEAAIGLGGRFRFTDDGVHGRLDLAYSRTGMEIYISLGEAF